MNVKRIRGINDKTLPEILRAAKIVHQMEVSYSSRKGAFGLEMEGGGKEMIDAPMLKQVSRVLTTTTC